MWRFTPKRTSGQSNTASTAEMIGFAEVRWLK
jgi:hypothetical protein